MPPVKTCHHMTLQSHNTGSQVDEWEEREDDEGNTMSPSCGDKCPHSHTGSGGGPSYKWCKPVKVYATTGAKPKAGNYEVVVQKVLNEAIPLYCSYLSMVNPYPEPMDKIRWVKKSWRDACEQCETHMAPNNKIIKLVSVNCQPTHSAHLF